MKISSRFRQLRPKKMFHCPVTVPQKVFHCPANRVSFHGSLDNECVSLSGIPRVSHGLDSPSSNSANAFPISPRPNIAGSIVLRKKILQSCWPACWLVTQSPASGGCQPAGTLSALSTPNKYRPADTGRSPNSQSIKVLAS